MKTVAAQALISTALLLLVRLTTPNRRIDAEELPNYFLSAECFQLPARLSQWAGIPESLIL